MAIKIVTLFQAYNVTMFKPDYSGYFSNFNAV